MSLARTVGNLNRKKNVYTKDGFSNGINLKSSYQLAINPLKAKLNPTCPLLALLGVHPIIQISRIRLTHISTILHGRSHTHST
jgi:hypothetical protein